MPHPSPLAKALLPLLIAGAAAPAAANTNGWDWDEEVVHRTWSDSKATWAHQLSPVHPSTRVIEALVGPPPRELWCGSGRSPSADDCEIHAELMEEWVEDFAGPDAHFDPTDYPAECPSSCYP